MSLLFIGAAILLLIVVFWCSKSSGPKNAPIKPNIPGRQQDCRKSCKFYETAGVVDDNGKKICYCAPTACNDLPPKVEGVPDPLSKPCTSGLECVNNTCQLQKCAASGADDMCPFGMSCDIATQKCDFDLFSINGLPDTSRNKNYVLASSPFVTESETYTPFKGFVSTTIQNLPGVGMNQTSFNSNFLSAYVNDQDSIPYPATGFTGFGKGPGEIYSIQYTNKGSEPVSSTIAGIGAPGPSVTITKKQ